jgi:hypothetical protein
MLGFNEHNQKWLYTAKKSKRKKAEALQKLRGKEEKSRPELSCFCLRNTGVIKPSVTGKHQQAFISLQLVYFFRLAVASRIQTKK